MNAKREKNRIVEWIRQWFEKNGDGCTAVIGISGGKDSSIVAALCAEALGRERVYGVLIPNGQQSDISDSIELCEALGIRYGIVNIADAFTSIISQVSSLQKTPDELITPTSQTTMNLPPRLRMSVLYAVSQSINGRVANTCNLSEGMIGWETLWGDAVGDFAPIANYTVSELLKIGLLLPIPEHLVTKKPSDGLCGKTDEDAFGFTYEQLDRWICEDTSGDPAVDKKILAMFYKTTFKRYCIDIDSCPGPGSVDALFES